ncbi:MAG: hypothetical protein Q9224_002917, partial [Gallowayella concinna]
YARNCGFLKRSIDGRARAYVFSPSFSTFVDVIAYHGLVSTGYVFVFLIWAALVWAWILGPARKLVRMVWGLVLRILDLCRKFLDFGFAFCGLFVRTLSRVIDFASWMCSWPVGKEVTAELETNSVSASNRMLRLRQHHAKTEESERNGVCSYPWNDLELWSYIESDVDDDEAAKNERVDKSVASAENENLATEIYQVSDPSQTLAATTSLSESQEAGYHGAAGEVYQMSDLNNSNTATHIPPASQEEMLRTMRAETPRDILTLRQQDPPNDQRTTPSSRLHPQAVHPTSHEIIAKIKKMKAETDTNHYPAEPTLDLALLLETQSPDTSNDHRDSSPPTTPSLDSPNFWHSSSSEASEARDGEELVSVAVPRSGNSFQDRWSSVFSERAGESEGEVMDRFEAALSNMARVEAYGQ